MSIRNTILVTLGTTFCFVACDANLGTSKALELESAALASEEIIWDISVDVDAHASGLAVAPRLYLSVPVDLTHGSLRGIDLSTATLALEDAETGDELAFSRVTFLGGRPAFDTLEVQIDDPCAQKARCALAFRVALRTPGPEQSVVASPTVEAFADAGEIRIEQR